MIKEPFPASLLIGVLDTMPSGIALFDAGERLIYLNRTLADWSGSAAGMLPGGDLAGLLPAAGDRSLLSQAMRAALAGTPSSHRLDLRCADASVRATWMHCTPQRGGDGAVWGASVVFTELSPSLPDRVAPDRLAPDRLAAAPFAADRQNPTLTALAGEQAFADAIIDSVPAIVLLLSPDGAIQRVNTYFEELSGYRLEEIRGKDWISTFLPERIRDEIRSLLATTSGGKETRGHVNPILLRNGEEREVEWSDTTIRDDSGRVVSVLAVGHDITELLRTQAALRHGQDLMREVVQLSHIGIFDHDHTTDTIYWSPEQRAIYGWSADEPVTLEKLAAHIHPQDAPRAMVAVQRAHDPAGDGRFDIEYRIIRRDGATRWVDNRSQTVFEDAGDSRRARRTTGATVDITERKLTEEALRASENRLRQAQAIAHIGNWELDLASGHLWWSDEIYRIFEIDQSRFGASYEAFLEAIDPDDRAAVASAYSNSVAQRLPYQITHRLRMPDGRVKWVEERGQTTYADDGTPLVSTGTVQDVTHQHEVEAALRESEASLRRDHRMARLGHWQMKYGPDGRWQNARPSDSLDYNEMLGTAPENQPRTVGELVERCVHPDDVAAYSRALDQLADPSVAGYVSEHRIVQPDGSIVFLHEIGESLFDASGRLVSASGVSQDVTEQRRTDLALRESQTLLEIGQRLANMGSYEWDLVTGRIIWSQQMWHIHRLAPQGEAPSHDVYVDMLHPDDRQKFRDMEARLLATGDPYELDFRIHRGDGEERIFHETGSAIRDESGRPVRAFGATQDVTEQRRNEIALREREDLLRQGARIGRFGTWVWDVTADRCLVCSEELAALFEMTVEEFLRERGSDRMIRIDPLRQETYPGEGEPFPEEGLPFEEEFRALTKHGEERWFHEIGQTYRDPSTGRLWCVGVTQDVTETKTAEAELRRLVEESARLAQLAEQSNQAKSEFLATMSHELRTPLNAIIGFSELLMMFGANLDRGKQDEYHGIVLQSGRHLLSLINDILDLAKVESGKLELRLESVSLKELVDECVSYLAPAARPKALSVEIDIPEIDFESDRRLLKQLLLNILSNAVKFNREGGQVRIMARHYPEDDDVTISIEDTGIGMTPDEVERALQPFTQVENTYSRTQEGTGLGLTLAQRFTAIFGGEFRIVSRKGVGTVITIRLPRRQHHPERAVAHA